MILDFDGNIELLRVMKFGMIEMVVVEIDNDVIYWGRGEN